MKRNPRLAVLPAMTALYRAIGAALLTIVVTSGCVTHRPELEGLPSIASYFDEDDSVTIAEPIDMLSLTPTMVEFARSVKGIARSDSAKLKLLLAGMLKRGLATVQYHPYKTLTAQETFEAQVGNCLSYTNLFVALAREAGMSVSYQTVDIPPNWSSDGESVIRNTHINTLVKNGRRDSLTGNDYSVDFNMVEYNDRYPVREVSDAYADAVFHGNLAVQAMGSGDMDTALGHLWRALEIDPNIPHLWVNLGVVRSRQGHDQRALDAYDRALLIDSNSPSALVNLVHAYDRLGLPQRSDTVRRQVQRLQRKNPYYHYQLASEAFESADYESSLAAVNRAIRLSDLESRFYGLQGKVYAKLGDAKGARSSFHLAERLAENIEQKAQFQRKLALLAGGS